MDQQDRRQPNEKIVPIVDRREQPERRRVPRWIERQQENGARDLTGYITRDAA